MYIHTYIHCFLPFLATAFHLFNKTQKSCLLKSSIRAHVKELCIHICTHTYMHTYIHAHILVRTVDTHTRTYLCDLPPASDLFNKTQESCLLEINHTCACEKHYTYIHAHMGCLSVCLYTFTYIHIAHLEPHHGWLEVIP